MSELDLENLIYRCIDNWAAGRRHERYGLCTSYDDKNHLAKAVVQPDGVETSWAPIEVQHAGNGFGVLNGLTPGDGKSTGDQVVLQFQEGEFEAPRIVGRVHSETDQAPQVKSGEMLMMHSKGHNLFFDKDGNKTLWHNMGDPPKGQQPPPSPAAQASNSNIKGSYKTIDKDGNHTSFSNKKKLTLDDGNGATHVHDGQGNIAATAKTINHTATNGDMTHSVQNGNYSRSASSNITDAAQSIIHNGPTNLNGNTSVTGNLGVSNILSANLMSVLGGFTGGGGMSMGGLSQLLGGAQISGGGSVTGGLTADTITNGGTGGPTWTTGTGAPTSVQPNSSLYSNISGTTGTRLYVSNGATWAAVASV